MLHRNPLLRFDVLFERSVASGIVQKVAEAVDELVDTLRNVFVLQQHAHHSFRSSADRACHVKEASSLTSALYVTGMDEKNREIEGILRRELAVDKGRPLFQILHVRLVKVNLLQNVLT